jgi:hypothetical protein
LSDTRKGSRLGRKAAAASDQRKSGMKPASPRAYQCGLKTKNISADPSSKAASIVNTMMGILIPSGNFFMALPPGRYHSCAAPSEQSVNQRSGFGSGIHSVSPGTFA